jgi:hypothetical protein
MTKDNNNNNNNNKETITLFHIFERNELIN